MLIFVILATKISIFFKTAIFFFVFFSESKQIVGHPYWLLSFFKAFCMECMLYLVS